jgi:hypothetical protein
MVEVSQLKTVDRNMLETIAPGIYLLDEPGKARVERVYNTSHEGDDPWIKLRYTGRILVRVREVSKIPGGVMDGWNRPYDGRAVVLSEETTLP